MNVQFKGLRGPESDSGLPELAPFSDSDEGPSDNEAMEAPRQSTDDERKAWIAELKERLRSLGTLTQITLDNTYGPSMVFFEALDSYLHGGIDRDLCEEIMFSCVKSGCPDNCELYAHILRVKGEAEQAFSYYARAADQGNLNATYNLGVCYYKGYGTEENLELAKEYFKIAAMSGVVPAYRLYGWLIRQSDPYEAALHLRLAIDQEDLEAVCPYAELLETQFQDYETAMEYWMDLHGYCSTEIKKYADGTEEQAKYRRLRSGVLVSLGHSCFRKYQTLFEEWREDDADKYLQCAVRYWRRAADEEDPQGLYQYGRMLNLGLGVNRNEEEAIRLFEKAGPLCPDAFWALAEIMSKNEGPEKAFKFIKSKKDMLPATAITDWFVDKDYEETMKGIIRILQSGGVAGF